MSGHISDQPVNGAALLDAIAATSDHLGVTSSGILTIDGIAASEIVSRYGSPLYVAIERTIVENYQRIRKAFVDRWDAPVEILYSFKSNNNLAIRAMLSQLGAGGDCFGEAELAATLAMGTAPSRVALNGSDKPKALLRQAIAAGVTINIDGEDEPSAIEEICRELGLRAAVNLRLKVLPEALNHYMSGSGLKHGVGVESVRRAKWGFTYPKALILLRQLLISDTIDIRGFSCHIGHLSNQPAAFAAVAQAFGEAVSGLHRETGYSPDILDIGGGWAREREPEQRRADAPIIPIEQQVEAAVTALREALGTLPALPALWAEPGRYIIGNGQLILASVGALKTDAGYSFAHVDVSTNNLPRIETGNFWHHMLPANKMHSARDTIYEVVGVTCFRSVLGASRLFPVLASGDLIAILDTGMYAEVFSNQFNGIPRPAGVMVSRDGTIEVIREAETIRDVFAHHRVPERFKPKEDIPHGEY